MASIRSPRGGLRVVAATVAALTLSLAVARLGDTNGPETLAYSASHLVGWRIAGVVLLIACGAWLWLAAAETITQSRWAIRLGAMILLVGAPVVYHFWAEAYWAARPWVSSHHVGGDSRGYLAGSVWRGTTGGECGYFALYEVRFDTDSTASGHTLASYIGAPLMSAVTAFGSYDSPRSRPVRAVVRNDSLWLMLDGPSLIPRPRDGPEIHFESETIGPLALVR